MEKNKGGRPLKFATVKELRKKIENYFKSITYTKPLLDENNIPIKNGLGEEIQQVLYSIPPTVTGLAIYLGTGRSTLMDYQRDDKFSNTIKDAKNLIEEQYERRLVNRGNSGDIFALKNFGWVDTIKVHSTATVTEVPAIIDDSR